MHQVVRGAEFTRQHQPLQQFGLPRQARLAGLPPGDPRLARQPVAFAGRQKPLARPNFGVFRFPLGHRLYGPRGRDFLDIPVADVERHGDIERDETLVVLFADPQAQDRIGAALAHAQFDRRLGPGGFGAPGTNFRKLGQQPFQHRPVNGYRLQFDRQRRPGGWRRSRRNGAERLVRCRKGRFGGGMRDFRLGVGQVRAVQLHLRQVAGLTAPQCQIRERAHETDSGLGQFVLRDRGPVVAEQVQELAGDAAAHARQLRRRAFAVLRGHASARAALSCDIDGLMDGQDSRFVMEPVFKFDADLRIVQGPLGGAPQCAACIDGGPGRQYHGMPVDGLARQFQQFRRLDALGDRRALRRHRRRHQKGAASGCEGCSGSAFPHHHLLRAHGAFR